MPPDEPDDREAGQPAGAPPALTIQRLAEAEHPEAAAIVSRSVYAFWAGHYGERVIRLVSDQNAPAWIRKRSLKQEDYLARVAGQPAGYAAVKRNEIGHLFVDPDWSRRGVGSALASFCCRWIAERGHDKAMVYASLNATGFYEKQGFRAVGTEAFELQPGVVLDAILMEKSLKVCEHGGERR